jgi:N utilization substance protein A
MVVVPEDQLSLAIGRAGVNARLAARLTGWRIDIKSLPEAAAESFQRLDSDAEFADLAEREAESRPTIEAILARKAENRPLTPEEYQVLTAFVDRVQRAVVQRRATTRQKEAARLEAVRASIPLGAHTTNLADTGLSTRVFNVLNEAGYATAGQVLEKLGLEEDAILGLEGIGPKAVEEIRETLGSFAYPLPVEPPVEAPVEEAAPAAEAAATVAAAATEAVAAEAGAPAPEGAAVAEGAEAVPADAASAAVAVEKTLETIAQEIVAAGEAEEEEEEGEKAEASPAGKKKKTKKVARTVEFDPTTGEMVVTRRRKRGDGEWGENL